MDKFLEWILEQIAFAHDSILRINDDFALYLNDKQLHFIVIGVIGLLMLMIVHPLFLWLLKRGRRLTISLIYVCTLELILTFGIEIGQYASGSGMMDFEDIVYGMGGFFLVALVISVITFIRRRVCRVRGTDGNGGKDLHLT